MKSVLIDGPSLHHMGLTMGIKRYNLDKLKEYLGNHVAPARELAHNMTVTVIPSMGKAASQQWRHAGFDVIETSGVDSADDQELIARINKLDERVTDIVLVSTDQDYFPSLQHKAKQGAKIWWVTSSGTQNGKPMFSPALRPFLGEGFEILDIVPHRIELMGLPTKMHPQKTVITPSRGLRIELGGAKSQEEYFTIISALTKTLRALPHIKFKFES